MATIKGTDKDDTLKLTPGAGSYSVEGGAGDDLLILNLTHVPGTVNSFNSGGSIGNDKPNTSPESFGLGLSSVERLDITCGGGDDYLFLFDGNDKISAGAGDDTMITRKGKAIINGGAGSDLWDADFSTSTADARLDLALAADEKQDFLGGSVKSVEHVTLTLGSGDDVIQTLTDAAGRGLEDRVNGGAGDDIASFGGGVDSFNGGEGDDLVILDYSDIKGGLTTSHSGGVISNNLTGADLAQVFLSGVERVHVTGGKGADQFFLFDGDDVVAAGAGNDDINTRAGKAVVDGGSGTDLWTADRSTATKDGMLDLASDKKQDFLGGSVKSIEHVSLLLGSGDDTVLTLTDAAGRGLADQIVGGAGDDVARFGGGVDSFNGGEGDDLVILDYSDVKGAMGTSHSGGVISNDLTGADLAQAFLSGVERVHFTGGAGNDQLFLFGGDDVVKGGKGDDDINTRGGSAVVDGGAGTDLWTADLTTMTANGTLDLASKKADGFLGGSLVNVEHVNLTLGSGNETVKTLLGAAGAGLRDDINGGDGDDVIVVGAGTDYVNGGLGNDLLVIDFSAAKGTFSTSSSGGWVGNDLSGVDAAGVGQGGFESMHLTAAGGNDNLYFLNSGDDIIDGGKGADTMNARGGDDSYYVDNKGDKVVEYAGEGTDTVFSKVTFTLADNVENLTLTGSAKINAHGNTLANVLVGNGDKNIMDGGAGRDILTGGKGADRFHFDDGDFGGATKKTADRITDFSHKQGDRIDLADVDAKSGGEDDKFSFIGDQAFKGHAGELRAYHSDGHTWVAGDLDGNKVADFLIRIDAKIDLVAGDFVL